MFDYATLCHLAGDYLLQNQRMATFKKTSSFWCLIHVGIYTSVFWFVLHPSIPALLLISSTHFLIDRFSLANDWMNFYGICRHGILPRHLRRLVKRGYAEWRYRQEKEFPIGQYELAYETLYPQPALPPDYITGILTIVVDNTMHLIINNIALNSF